MLKRQFVTGLFLFISLFASAQILQPVKWDFQSEQVSKDTFLLHFTANIDDGWYIYSQHIEPGGPIPTSFHFDDDENIRFIGQISENGAITKEGFDPIFEMPLKKYGKQATFTQKVVLLNPVESISGQLEFMTCDDSRCLPPELVDFRFDFDEPSLQVDEATESAILNPVSWHYTIEKHADDELTIHFIAEIDDGWYVYSQFLEPGGPIPTAFHFKDSVNLQFIGKAEETGESVKEGFDPVFEMPLKKFAHKAVFSQRMKLLKPAEKIDGYLQFMTCDDTRCLPPEYLDFSLDINTLEGVIGEVNQPFLPADSPTTAAIIPVDSEPVAKKSIWLIFLLGFGGGLIALLTPCVFPMIPLTVSFFTKQSSDRKKGISNALIYALSIVVIYVSLGFIITKLFGSDALNALSTNVIFNILFFIIFVVFAISFFGYFELTLPSSWINKTDKLSERGGLIGIFFMAFTLALVSFSCTGPIIGTLLVETAIGGNDLGPLMGMTGFALALAIPFALFAMFPGWLNSLPKSGGWLNSVKVVLGFIELALALKFLSNADLVSQWGLIKRETFLILWIIIALGLAAYLLGFIRFPHDSPVDKPGKVRISFSLLTLAFAGYLVSGLFGKHLSLISGFPPPDFYSYAYKGHCPHNLKCVHDYDEGLEYARQTNKPLLIDFTGWACVNCRKMEENVWVDDRILNMLQKDYVLVSLYVDDKQKLPEEEQYISAFSGKKIITIGNKWSDFQASRFGANSQPYYVILDHNENLLLPPRGYTPDRDEFYLFLKEGLEKFNNHPISME